MPQCEFRGWLLRVRQQSQGRPAEGQTGRSQGGKLPRLRLHEGHMTPSSESGRPKWPRGLPPLLLVSPATMVFLSSMIHTVFVASPSLSSLYATASSQTTHVDSCSPVPSYQPPNAPLGYA